MVLPPLLPQPRNASASDQLHTTGTATASSLVVLPLKPASGILTNAVQKQCVYCITKNIHTNIPVTSHIRDFYRQQSVNEHRVETGNCMGETK